jgi:Tfp pilus assembly protein PilW
MTRHRGVTLVELLVYLAILVFLLLVIFNVVLGMARAYNTLVVVQNIEDSASFSLERMTREIRNAEYVDPASSLGEGDILLHTTEESGTPRSVRIYVEEGRLVLQENGGDAFPLTRSDTYVEDAVFILLSTPHSEAIRTTLTFSSGADELDRTKTFYSTIVLRGSYQTH